MTEIGRAAKRVFFYPESVLPRRHGPRGYLDYGSYKPWLRDEFAFRCVYCLCRETWKPNGHDGFSVDHVLPQATHPEAAQEYDNLLYACVSCNSRRQNVPLPIEPGSQPLGDHLRIDREGEVEALTLEGQRLIELCRLDRATLTHFRQRLLSLVRFLSAAEHPEAKEALVELLSLPADLPDLASLRPPGGNARPDGIAASYYERRRRGDIPDVY
jgi:hypothetical protein